MTNSVKSNSTEKMASITIFLSILFFSILYFEPIILSIMFPLSDSIIKLFSITNIVSIILGIISLTFSFVTIFYKNKVTYILNIILLIITIPFFFFARKLGLLFGVLHPIIVILIIILNKKLFNIS